MEQEFVYQNVSLRLEKILGSIEKPGEFCTFGRISEPMPKLEVENVGILSFPVPSTQIEQLIEVAEPAPYGKGSQTLVDLSVRNCLQINADRLSLAGRSWDKTIRRIRHLSADGLGCPRKRLKAQLYKLLVYPTGGFFIPHRDTEKSNGMIATLTVSLPVEGTGGELTVRHKDREVTVEMNVNDPSELAYAAFYADCQHEIKTVQTGHRIVLVYNLCLEPGEDSEKFQTVPDYAAELDEIVKELQIWCRVENAPNKLVWILEHKYSQAGLSFDTLKNGDRALADVLRSVTDRAECELYASILQIYETYYAWDAGGAYWDPMDYVVDELLESQSWMDSWVAPDGGSPNFGEMSINDYELMPTGVLDDANPDDEEFEEATGNEGATVERTYHFTALVLFRSAGILDELVNRSAGPGVAWIAEKLSRNGQVVDDSIINSVEHLTDIWPDEYYHFDLNHHKSISKMLRLLLKLGSQRTSIRFLRKVAIRDYEGSINVGLSKLLSTLDPPDTEEILRTLIRRKFHHCSEEILQLLLQLDSKLGYSAASSQQIFALCTAEILQLLPETLSQMTEEQHSANHFYSTEPSKFGKNAISNLIRLLGRADAMEDVPAVSEVFENYPEAASLDRAMPKALVKLRQIGGIFRPEACASLWRASAQYLLDRSGIPPESPMDWKIPYSNSCHCQDCKKLRNFCEDPVKSVARFPLKKDLRAHLHQIIDANRLDIFHETERKGRPFTLVCTKNRATYERRLKEYAKDIKHMTSLVEVMADVESRPENKEKHAELQVAIELSRHPE